MSHMVYNPKMVTEEGGEIQMQPGIKINKDRENLRHQWKIWTRIGDRQFQIGRSY